MFHHLKIKQIIELKILKSKTIKIQSINDSHLNIEEKKLSKKNQTSALIKLFFFIKTFLNFIDLVTTYNKHLLIIK